MMHPEDLEIRSEEVQEILGTPPRWITRWGTLMAFVLFVILGWVGYWVKYPEMVQADIRVTSTDPARKIRAPKSTLISQVLVQNEDTVQAGQPLLVYNSTAKVGDVLKLEAAVSTIQNPDEESLLAFNPGKDLLLGSLQDDLYEFLKKREQLSLEKTRKSEKLDVSQLRQRIRKAQKEIEYAKRRRETLEKEYELARIEHIRQQNYYHANLAPINKVQAAEADLLNKSRLLQSAQSDIKTNEYEIELLRNEIDGVKQSSNASKSNVVNDLIDGFVQLQKAIENWKVENLAIAPTSGVVLITNEDVRNSQYVQKEDELMVVVPNMTTESIGRISLNPYGSGKVHPGQKVVVKLSSYPFQEFGALEAIVEWKGKIPVEGKIPIEVSFPEGLVTNTGYNIEQSQEMIGKAEIIIDRKRVLEWIFEQIRRVTS